MQSGKGCSVEPDWARALTLGLQTTGLWEGPFIAYEAPALLYLVIEAFIDKTGIHTPILTVRGKSW